MDDPSLLAFRTYVRCHHPNDFFGWSVLLRGPICHVGNERGAPGTSWKRGLTAPHRTERGALVHGLSLRVGTFRDLGPSRVPAPTSEFIGYRRGIPSCLQASAGAVKRWDGGPEPTGTWSQNASAQHAHAVLFGSSKEVSEVPRQWEASAEFLSVCAWKAEEGNTADGENVSERTYRTTLAHQPTTREVRCASPEGKGPRHSRPLLRDSKGAQPGLCKIPRQQLLPLKTTTPTHPRLPISSPWAVDRPSMKAIQR